MKTIKSAQALRAVAALLVLLFHTRHTLNFPFYPLGENLFGTGLEGVVLFFMLSGFVMAYTSKSNGPLAARVFWIHRIARIVPLYWLATIAYTFVLGQGLGGFDEVFWKSLVFYPINMSRPPLLGLAKLPNGWTLNYEAFFYLIFGTSLLFKRWRWCALFSAFGILLIGFPLAMRDYVALHPTHQYGFSITYLNLAINPISWHFLAGVLIGCSVGKGIGARLHKGIFGWMTLSSVAFVLWQNLTWFHGGTGIYQWGIPLAVMCWLLIEYEITYGLEVPAWLGHLGNISYSIYLIHPIMLIGIQRFLISSGFERLTTGPSFALAVLLSTLLVSNVTYHLIEVRLSSAVRATLLKWCGAERNASAASASRT